MWMRCDLDFEAAELRGVCQIKKMLCKKKFGRVFLYSWRKSLEESDC